MWFQSKVEEAEFNDVPAGNCDIPDTSAVLREVIWKIWTWKESTKTIQIFAWDTSCEQKTFYQLTFKRMIKKGILHNIWSEAMKPAYVIWWPYLRW